MPYLQHDGGHLIEGNERPHSRQSELGARERGGNTLGVASLAGDLHKAAHRVAYQAEHVGDGYGGGVECLLRRTAVHLHERGCGHGICTSAAAAMAAAEPTSA